MRFVWASSVIVIATNAAQGHPLDRLKDSARWIKTNKGWHRRACSANKNITKLRVNISMLLGDALSEATRAETVQNLRDVVADIAESLAPQSLEEATTLLKKLKDSAPTLYQDLRRMLEAGASNKNKDA